VEELDYDPNGLKALLPGLDLTVSPLSWPAHLISFPIAWEERARWSPDLARLAQALLALSSWGGTEGLLVPKVGAALWREEGSPKRLSVFFTVHAPLVPFLVRALREAPAPPPPSLERGGLAVAEWEGGTELVRVERVYEAEARVGLWGGGQAVLPLSRLQPLPKGVLAIGRGFEPAKEAFELGLDDLAHRLKEELGLQKALVTTPAAPLQIEGVDGEGRTLYFRERGGHASLCLSYKRGVPVDEMLEKDACVYVWADWPQDEGEDWREVAFRVVRDLYLRARKVLARRLGAPWLPSAALKVEGRDPAFLEVSLAPERPEAAELKEVHPGIHLVLSGGKVVALRVSEETLAHPEILRIV